MVVVVILVAFVVEQVVVLVDKQAVDEPQLRYARVGSHTRQAQVR